MLATLCLYFETQIHESLLNISSSPAPLQRFGNCTLMLIKVTNSICPSTEFNVKIQGNGRIFFPLYFILENYSELSQS